MNIIKYIKENKTSLSNFSITSQMPFNYENGDIYFDRNTKELNVCLRGHWVKISSTYVHYIN